MRILLALALLAPSPDDGPSAPLGAGWSRLNCGDEEVEVYRDAWGVPHVFAKTWRAAFRAEGYLEAQDRLFQMDTFRRAGKGELAELQGRAALPQDRDRRRRGYTEAELRKMFEAGDERFRAIVAAYTEGVNDFLREGKDLPPEYAKLGAKPRPWSETDCVAIGVLMARRFGEAGDQELTVARVLEQLVRKVGEADARKILDDLLRPRDPSAPTTLHDHLRAKAEPPREKGRAPAPGMGDGAWTRYRAELEEVFASRAAFGIPSYSGSNAWVAAPKKSRSGHAMLYGGPMMGFGTPAICNEVHLAAEGLNVGGMSFPGVPGVMIGWNDRVAWTTTSGGADLVDVYALELHPDDPGRYRHGGEWRNFEVVEHEIAVRGEAPEKLQVLRSVHGPLAGDPDPKNRRAHALRMSFWMREQKTFEAVMDMDFSASVADFEAAAKKVVTSHNFFCATADGRVGFWFCGAYPKRAEGHDARFPQDGSGKMEWAGIRPFEDWPRSVDPPHGFFANWNNKPARDWEPAGFGKIFWGKKIIDVLEGEEKLSFERFGAIARLTAYHAYLADYFVPHILEAAKGSEDADVKKAVEILSSWDRLETPGHPGPNLVERWVRAAMVRAFGHIVDPILLASREIQRFVVDPLLYLLEGDACLVTLNYDYLKGRDRKEFVLAALKDALKGGVEKLAWEEPEINFKGEVGKVKSKNGRGTYQQVVEMTPAGPRAVTVSAPGQSERPESKHHRDQVDLFAKWQYKPFVWRREEMK
jgi:penicillin amidase